MKDELIAPDFGHRFQDFNEPKPFGKPEFTPQERDNIASFKVALERKRREQNELNRKAREAGMRGNNARLGIDWPDDAA